MLSAGTMVDASRSNLHGLHIELDQSRELLSLKLPKQHFRLSVSGELSRFSATGDMPSSLTLAPRTSRRKNDSPLLDRFIAYNVEEISEKRLKLQMKTGAKTRPWTDYASEAVRKLSQSDHLIGRPIIEEMAQRWFDAVHEY
ncbi:hypothetical protein [Paenibacillus endoradicis]|uniref:hypothetical protein n=1 Tax=Paenibacillus endoradicis TaxID=2972487 RepID=UPI002159265D|nr:hypothetical protein [Paenibacillus endoradicis]